MRLEDLRPKQKITPCKAACCISIERTSEETYDIIADDGERIGVTRAELTAFAQWLKEAV